MSDELSLGQKLRAARLQRGLSLSQVEKETQGLFKSSIVGAYERGERNITIRRLRMLARFYQLGVEELLAPASERRATATDQKGVRIHLPSVANLPSKQRLVIQRFIDYVRERRGDPTQDIITLRQEDLLTLACVLGIQKSDLATSMQRRRVLP